LFDVHSLHKKPKDSRQKMWRYLKLERLIQLIEKEEIFFTHLPKMNDKWEGLLTKRTREALYNWELNRYKGNVAAATGAMRQQDENREHFYLSCWHMNDFESYLMWKAYGDKGCAIQTTFERISCSFDNTPASVEGCCVEYIDYERDEFGPGNVYIPIGFKDKPYRDEHEFRLIFWKSGEKNQKLIPGEKGISIKVDTNMLIDNIYINPNFKQDLGQLEETIKRKGLDCEIRTTKVRE
jgi:hypothetical protein